MHGPECICCDRGNCILNDDGWCDACVARFEEVMKTIQCARTGHCNSKLVCLSQKKCVQTRAALIVHGEPCEVFVCVDRMTT